MHCVDVLGLWPAAAVVLMAQQRGPTPCSMALSHNQATCFCAGGLLRGLVRCHYGTSLALSLVARSTCSRQEQYSKPGGMEYQRRSLCQCHVQGTCPDWVLPSPVVGTGLTWAGCQSLVHTSLVHQPVTMSHTRNPFCITLVHGGPHFQTVGGQHAHLAHMHASQPPSVKCLTLGPSATPYGTVVLSYLLVCGYL